MEQILCNEELRELVLSVGKNVKEGESLEKTFGSQGQMDILCKFAPVIIAALNIAKIFVGKREKEIINAVIDFLQQKCSIN